MITITAFGRPDGGSGLSPSKSIGVATSTIQSVEAISVASQPAILSAINVAANNQNAVQTGQWLAHESATDIITAINTADA